MPERPVVLFVCVHNAGRSQMAAALLQARSGGRVEVRSAGSEPADEINPVAVEAMSEIGLDIRSKTTKLLTSDAVEAADVVILNDDLSRVVEAIQISRRTVRMRRRASGRGWD